MTLEEAKAILAALVHEHVEFVVIGSMAMAAQGLPRATHDLDLFVSPKIENLEAVKRVLRDLFNDPNVRRQMPSVQTPASTTRSRRSWRYSTSVMSSSSVESPWTRRSAARSSRSSWSPS